MDTVLLRSGKQVRVPDDEKPQPALEVYLVFLRNQFATGTDTDRALRERGEKLDEYQFLYGGHPAALMNFGNLLLNANVGLWFSDDNHGYGIDNIGQLADASELMALLAHQRIPDNLIRVQEDGYAYCALYLRLRPIWSR